jgi:hypothetical protein
MPAIATRELSSSWPPTRCFIHARTELRLARLRRGKQFSSRKGLSERSARQSQPPTLLVPRPFDLLPVHQTLAKLAGVFQHPLDRNPHFVADPAFPGGCLRDVVECTHRKAQ